MGRRNKGGMKRRDFFFPGGHNKSPKIQSQWSTWGNVTNDIEDVEVFFLSSSRSYPISPQGSEGTG